MIRLASIAALTLLACTTTAPGHIIIESPNGGEVVTAGSTVELRWRILLSHGTQQNWDILYSDKSSSGPWTPIATDVPVGDPNVGSIHTFDWTVPESVLSSNVFVRVIQDNSDTDYEDTNDNAITITCEGDTTGDHVIDVTDLLDVLSAWGTCGTCDADVNNDQVVDVSDMLIVLSKWGAC